jgi:hypothetical protein
MGTVLFAAPYSDADAVGGIGCKIGSRPATDFCVGSVDMAALDAGRMG